MNQQEENFKLVVTKEDILNRLIDSVDQECHHPATLARKKDRDSLFSRIGFLEEKYLLGIRIRMNDLYQQLYRKYLGKQYIQEIVIYRNEKFSPLPYTRSRSLKKYAERLSTYTCPIDSKLLVLRKIFKILFFKIVNCRSHRIYIVYNIFRF